MLEFSEIRLELSSATFEINMLITYLLYATSLQNTWLFCTQHEIRRSATYTVYLLVNCVCIDFIY